MSENNNDFQEKTEEPTAKRKEDALKEGQVLRSKELNTMLIILASSSGLLILGDTFIEKIKFQFANNFILTRSVIFSHDSTVNHLLDGVYGIIKILLPFFILMLIVAFFAPLTLGGWSFSAKSIAPKMNRMSLSKGLKRMFSIKALMELAKALAKFLVIGMVAVTYLYHASDKLLSLGRLPIENGLYSSIHIIALGFILISTALIALAIVDVPFQIWEHTKKLKMSRQDIKDEYKESEGRPEIKRKIKQLQMEMSKRRMMESIPSADVIITNPSHYAVALKYHSGNLSVPVVCAKGTDLIAEKIKEIAKKYNVIIVCAPPLSRALFHTTQIDDEIPEGLYVAVAKILAYVYQLNQNSFNYDEVQFSEELSIPDEYKY